MNIFLASTADLYAEHRRTQSRRKREKIAAELQRRHDALNGGSLVWRVWEGMILTEGDKVLGPSGGRWRTIQRFNFALWLP